MRVTPMQTEDTIQIFIAAINNQNVEQIVELCTEDHRFIDAHGGVVTRDALRQAWTAYFAFMPIYRIETEAIISRDGMAAVFGWASGGLDASRPDRRVWRRPCAWRADIVNDRVALWQVYIDTKAVFDLLQ